MQRVASELLDVLAGKPDISLNTILLRCPWRWVHFLILPFLIRAHFRLRLLAEGRDIDVVLFSSMVTATLSLPLENLFRTAGIKTGVIVHGQDVTTPIAPYQGIVSKVFSAVDFVFPVSSATAEACLSRGLCPDKVRVVHNGVDVSRFDPLRSRQEMREELHSVFSLDMSSLPEGSILLCSLGRHVRRKGFAWFIENVMPLLDRRIHYWLGGSGPESEAIRKAIERTGLSRRIRMLGLISDEKLMALYRGSDLFIMPNIPVSGDMEGFGIVMLEAGMNGLQTVASRLEGIREVIREGENGYFVESGDARGFARVINEFVSDTDALPRARERALDYTERTFRWDTVAEQYIRLLSDLPATA
jgi:phosphatidyl-myo-inositol dimannoside synthase